MSMIYCPNMSGIDSLACISAATNYTLGYIFLVLLIATLYFGLGREPTRERFASIGIFISIITALGAVKEMLFPTQFFIVSIVLGIGAVAMLVIRK